MICKLCHNKIDKKDKKIKAKGGSICRTCYGKFPRLIEDNIKTYKINQLKHMMGIISVSKSQVIAQVGNMRVCDHAIQLKGMEIALKDISNISLSFHPNRIVRYNYVHGQMTLGIETVSPRLIIEDTIDNITVNYRLDSGKIIYDLPKNLSDLVKKLNQTIADKTYTTKGFFKTNYTKPKKNAYEEARLLLGVGETFTEKALREARNRMMKEIHPDQPGGDAEMAKRVNSAYDTLNKYKNGKSA